MPQIVLLAIESSCDDTSAAVCADGRILSNLTANQQVHERFGGVVPELASRAHMQNIIPVVDGALKNANISKEQLSAIAFTRGPGLLGSLLVGGVFAKTLAQALHIPLIDVHHMQAHVLAHFIPERQPAFPFLCLTVSGGHTQIVLVRDHFNQEVIGETLDDAAGEAFDKTAKMLGIPYPGGPLLDQYAKQGDPGKFAFTEPEVKGLNFSFSGLKTQVLYFLQGKQQENPHFMEENLADICASVQDIIVKTLLNKLKRAAKETGIKEVGLAGGVSANSELRRQLDVYALKYGWNTFIPEMQYCTDNAGMIAIAAYYKYLNNDFCPLDIPIRARLDD
jgi:N6-L-threonylcarbamoyladenine synthase